MSGLDPRRPADDRELLAELARLMRADRLAGVLVGTVHTADDGRCDVSMSFLDMDPIDLVAAADALLEAASERMAADPDLMPSRDCLLNVEAARAALDFKEETHDA